MNVACFFETREACVSCCIDLQQTVHSWHYPSLSHLSILIQHCLVSLCSWLLELFSAFVATVRSFWCRFQFGTRESLLMFISILQKNQAGAVGVVTRLRCGWQRYHGWFRGKKFLYFLKRPDLLCGLPNLSLSGGPSSLPSSVEVENEWRRTSTLPLCFHGINNDNFTFSFNSAKP